MLNQLIRIQTRYIGLIADGCPMDGLAGIAGVLPLRYRQPLGYLDFLANPDRNGCLRFSLRTGNGLTKHLYRLRHWHSLVPGFHGQKRQG